MPGRMRSGNVIGVGVILIRSIAGKSVVQTHAMRHITAYPITMKGEKLMTRKDLRFQLRQNVDPHHEIPDHIWNPWADETLAREFQEDIPDSEWNRMAEDYKIRDAIEERKEFF